MIRAIALLLATVVAAPRLAVAACSNVNNVCSFAQLAACCNLDGATKCNITGPINVAAGPCTIDFGSRDVTVKGPGGVINAGTGSLTIKAGSFAFATGGKLLGVGSANGPGAFVSFTTTGHAQTAFSVDGTIDVSGGGFPGGGGTVEVHADGSISIAPNANVIANALDAALIADAGGIFMDTSAGDIVIDGALVVHVSRNTDPVTLLGSSGTGGTVQLAAANDLLIRNPRTSGAASIDVRGGGLGGSVDLHAGHIMTLQYFTIIDASAMGKTSGDGGQVLARADGVFKDAQDKLYGLTASGIITVAGGSSGNSADPGGSGGSIELDTTTGPLVVDHGTTGLVLDGAAGGYGGTLELHTDTPAIPNANPPTDGTLTVATPISAKGNDGNGVFFAGGGDLTIDSKGTFTLASSSPINLNSGGDQGGSLDVSALRDVVLNSSITGSDVSQDADGGNFTVAAGHDIVINQDVDFDGGPGSSGAQITGGGGGNIAMQAGNDLDVKPGKLLSASGGFDSQGGQIELRATRDVLVEGNSQVVANSGASGQAPAGSVTIVAGSDATAGNVTIAGSLKANGRAPLNPANQAQCDTALHGTIDVAGCAVSITGTVTSAGDCGATNTITVRKQYTMSGGTLRAQSQANFQGVNTVRFKSNLAAGGGAALLPQATVSLAGGTRVPEVTQVAVDECASGHTQNCVFACPTCGDGVTTYPETCDVNGDRCTTHCAHCRTEDCTTGNACSLQYCDTLGGCFLNVPLPDGTSCDDGNACTDVDKCLGGLCENAPHDCSDGNPCTDDTCNPNASPGSDPCQHANHPNGNAPAPCDDGHMCNGFEQCVNGACTPGVPDPCDDGNPSTLDACTPQTDLCSQLGCSCTHTGVPCVNNGDCQHDVCMSGTCAGGFCSFTALTGNSCDDGNACTVNDKCQSGVCAPGTPKACGDGLACTTDSCNEANGQCVNTPIAGCCEADKDCQAGGALDDGNVCTSDACGPDHTCTHTEITGCCIKDNDCDDMNVCTGEPAGICALVDPQNPAQGRHCTAHTQLSGAQPGCGEPCNPAQCVPGNATSTCTPTVPNPAACAPDNDVCTVDFCDAQTGACKHDAIPNCCHADGECDDHDTCTTDSCTEAHQCQHVARFDGCLPCSTDVDCDPLGRCAGRLCGGDGTCQSTAAVNCSDGNLNTEDTCTLDASNQPVCTHACRNNAACDDHNPCNGDETCNRATGACVASAAPDCDDHDDCSADACDIQATSAATACVHRFPTGYDLVGCRIGAIGTVLGDSTNGIATGLRRKLDAKYRTVTKALDKVRVMNTQGNAKGETKALKKLRAAVTQFGNLVKAQCGKHKLPSGVCGLLTPDVQRASDAIAGIVV